MSQARLGKNVGQKPLEHEHKKAWQINIKIQFSLKDFIDYPHIIKAR